MKQEPLIIIEPLFKMAVVQFGNMTRYVQADKKYAEELEKAIKEVKRLAD